MKCTQIMLNSNQKQVFMSYMIIVTPILFNCSDAYQLRIDMTISNVKVIKDLFETSISHSCQLTTIF